MPIDPTSASPREIEAYLRDVILKTFGDKVENKSNVYAHRGYYSVSLVLENEKYVEFNNFRRGDVKQIARSLRALKVK